MSAWFASGMNGNLKRVTNWCRSHGVYDKIDRLRFIGSRSEHHGAADSSVRDRFSHFPRLFPGIQVPLRLEQFSALLRRRRSEHLFVPESGGPPMRRFVTALTVVLLGVGVVLADEIAGTIKSLDPDKGSLVLSVNGKTEKFRIARATKILDSTGKELPGGLTSPELKIGAEVTVVTEKVGKKATAVKELRLGKK
ncbi:MAG: hypothetical protein NZ700_16715 [Gemmataceae bacterium]|nr:hypothetical protein [Gemmataceae bacterium]MDW8266387.1 hypothetical protein [Gemmataceae bacterium]